MFMILKTPHQDIHEPLTEEEIEAAVKHILTGKVGVTEEEYQALKHAVAARFRMKGTP